MNTHTTALDSAHKNPLDGKEMPAAKKSKNVVEAVVSLPTTDGKYSAQIADRRPKNDDRKIQSVACVANGTRNEGQRAFVSSQPLTIQTYNFHFQKLSYHKCFM